jgi:hypothetical protein
MPAMTMTGAAERFAADLSPAAAEEDVWAAIFDGARAAQFTGTILGPVTASAAKGAITAGRQVYELIGGEVTDRYFTQSTRRGQVVWVTVRPGSPACAGQPQGAWSDEIKAMDACQRLAAEPLGWAQGPDGAFRADDSQHGQWAVIPLLVDAS